MRIAIGGISHETQAIQTHDFAKLQYLKRRRNFFSVEVRPSVLSSAGVVK